MKLFEFKKENRRLFINIFGIKLNFVLPFRGNNKIILVKKDGSEKRVPFIWGIKTNFHGKNSILKIHEPLAQFKNCKFTFADDVEINIESSNSVIFDLNIIAEANGSKFIADKNFKIVSGEFLFYKNSPNHTIKIGKDCLFSKNITIRISDGHIIKDINTNEIINESKDIVIGDHVWITEGVTIFKGSVIPNNTIVGYKSLVTKKFTEENTIIAGIPAKIVKRNIKWEE